MSRQSRITCSACPLVFRGQVALGGVLGPRGCPQSWAPTVLPGSTVHVTWPARARARNACGRTSFGRSALAWTGALALRDCIQRVASTCSALFNTFRHFPALFNMFHHSHLYVPTCFCFSCNGCTIWKNVGCCRSYVRNNRIQLRDVHHCMMLHHLSKIIV